MTSVMDEIYAELSEKFGAASIGDPFALFAERRRTTPVMEGDVMAELGLPSMAQRVDGSRKMFTFFRYDDITAALRDHETFTAKVVEERFFPVLGRTMGGMDGEEHRQFRGLYKPGFTRRLIEKWRQEIIRPVARRNAEQLVANADGKSVDLVDYGLRYPVRMIYEILGFPTDDEASYEQFASSGLKMLLAIGGTDGSNPEEAQRTIDRAVAESTTLYAAIKEIIVKRRAEGAGGDDLMGHMMRAEFEGRQLTDDELTNFFRSLVPAASETTTRTWLNSLLCLLERPDVLDEVRENRELLPAAMDEGFRLQPATPLLARGATRDVEVRGITIPAGAGITLVTGSANRDENAFENPDEYDIRRTGPPSLTFGFGMHLCAGLNTARTEMIEATDALLDLLPNLRLDPAAEKPEIRGVNLRGPLSLRVVWD